jgi:membrane associated rhomboid family serine protease
MVMGINDRDYVRREGPSFLGSFAERGKICKWLIGINVVVFVLQLLTSDSEGGLLTNALVLNADKVVFHGEIWRLLTYAFLHDTGQIFHLLFNMLFLWWFGSDVEDMYGPREFLAFYLVSAVLGGVAFTAARLIGSPSNLCLGASGAVTAVLVLYAFHYPRRVIYLFMFLPVPIWLFVIGSVAIDAYTLLSRQASMVAVTVHLGGAAFAFVYYKQHLRITSLFYGLWPSFLAGRRRLLRPHLRVYREEAPEPIRAAVAPAPDEDRIKVEMDEVLEKMSRVGRENLTENDLNVLRRASEILRRRRT